MIERLFADAPTSPVSRLWVWRLLFPPIRAFVMLFIEIGVHGREHIPASGPYIVASNHINWKDPPVVSLALAIPIRWMAKVEVFRWFVVGFLLRGIGSIAVRRGESDRRAMVTGLRVLEKGLPLGVFPEGHRSEDGRLLRGRPGIGLLAERTNALIVPCGITGTPTARFRLIRRREVEISFGPPFRVSDLPPEERTDHQAVADAVMRRIAAQLPEAMRGMYA